MRDGTQIYDIKTYLKITDCRPDATDGFAENTKENNVNVVFECDTAVIPETDLITVRQMLEQDPHPSYKTAPDRVYGMKYKDYDIKFTVSDGAVCVKEIKK